ncbi:hypothetical protein HKX48_005604 [Thoreauomyces humboldtii]|nr:hypothetical protein HKX48_005604 [Thoreauomyces humboldtii]
MHRRRPEPTSHVSARADVANSKERRASVPTSKAYLVLTAFLLWCGVLAAFATKLHTRLPRAGKCGNGLEFSECNARETIRGLAHTIGMRLVGTKQEAMARDLILDQLYFLKRQAEEVGGSAVFEIDVQVADGSHRFDLMGHALIKTYSNITNIVARLSCGRECDSNAILLNSHFDSTIVSPGASDDGAGVAIMLEHIRILSQRKEKLTNSVIFLWNGAEETLQDASHAFITQHPWRSAVRAVINLEAMGQAGKEILFQANSVDMVNAYSKVPHPHGSVLSNDIFRTGLVMSDTDYRQFIEHGDDLVGLDLAFYQNSYLYHTMLDVEDTIEEGSVQNFGENSLAMLNHLLYGSVDLANMKRSNDIVFFDILGLWFVHYSWSQAHIMHWAVAAAAVLSTLFTSRRRMASIFGATVASNLLSVVLALWLGVTLQYVLNKPLVWFAREWYSPLLFAPTAVLGSLLPQIWLARRTTPTASRSGNPDLERGTYDMILLWFATLVLLTDFFRLGLSYIFTFYVVFMLLGKAIDALLSPKAASHLHPLAYFVAAVPFTISTALSVSTLNLFIPLTGRIGADAPTDVIVGVLTGALTFLHWFLLLPLFHRFSESQRRNLVGGLATLSFIIAFVFVATIRPFDSMHPKRVFVEYKENISDGTREVMVAHADPGSFPELLTRVEAAIGSSGQLRTASQTGREWATIAPFSNFMESFAFDVSHMPAIEPPPARTPDLTVTSDHYDPATQIRRISLSCAYNHYIWTVLTFTARVQDWSLADKTILEPERDHKYTVRNAGGYPTTSWNLDLVLHGDAPLVLELSALEQDTFHELVDEDDDEGSAGEGGRRPVGTALGSVRVGRAWKWTDRFGSARILADVERAMPDWATGLFIGVVVQVFTF